MCSAGKCRTSATSSKMFRVWQVLQGFRCFQRNVSGVMMFRVLSKECLGCCKVSGVIERNVQENGAGKCNFLLNLEIYCCKCHKQLVLPAEVEGEREATRAAPDRSHQEYSQSTWSLWKARRPPLTPRKPREHLVVRKLVGCQASPQRMKEGKGRRQRGKRKDREKRQGRGSELSSQLQPPWVLLGKRLLFLQIPPSWKLSTAKVSRGSFTSWKAVSIAPYAMSLLFNLTNVATTGWRGRIHRGHLWVPMAAVNTSSLENGARWAISEKG